MTIYSVTDPQFKPYGKILTGYDTTALLEAMKEIPLPESGTSYKPYIDSLQAVPIYQQLQESGFGGLKAELGMCWGHNTKLNCLEYHRSSEINIGTEDFILLLAKEDEITDGVLDTSKVKAFRVPAGTVIEVYATTLHYAPCHTDEKAGFRVAVVLPYGTNFDLPRQPAGTDGEDRLLWAENKWLLAHKDTTEAANGAYVGLAGENIDIADSL